MNKKHFTLILLVIFSACSKDPENENTPSEVFSASTGGVYVTNEGNFGSSNATLTYFDPFTAKVTPDAWMQANNTALGSLCQSMIQFNDKVYIVMNGSGKIEVCHPHTLVKTATITGLQSPRYILPVSATKAYVSDMAANQVYKVDLSTNTVTGGIAMPGATEEMAFLGNKLYITCSTSDKLYVADIGADSLVDSLTVNFGANSLRLDAEGKLWILCGGDYFQSIPGSLHKIDPSTMQEERVYPFTSADYPSRLRMNGTRDTVYFLNTGVFKMPLGALSLPVNPFIAPVNQNFYGLGIDSASGIIYVSDAVDFVQKGEISRHRKDGTKIESFQAGIIPGDFLFVR
jgi:DNA-binding beta-propeller fold protein YncE